jgi:2-oxo-4-hydroxy-4-carboxy-5-ureidoimidazoline decarboxylase
VTLDELNAASREAFVARLGGVYEHSPWVAERAWQQRPFAGIEALHRGMQAIVARASRAEQLALLRAHPELAGQEARAGALTADSSSEQARLGFTALSQEEFRKMAALNRAYREKFGFPCIVALRLHASRASVMKQMEQRLAHDAGSELAAGLEQIGHITRGRLEKMLEEAPWEG